MSDDESTDGLEDLQELMAIYGNYDKSNRAERSSHKDVDDENDDEDKKTEPAYVEVPMEKVIFGDKQAFLANLAKSVGNKRPPQHRKESEDDDKDNDKEESAKKHKPAWSDSDDEDLEVGEVKRQTRHTGPLNHLRKDKSYKEYLTARFHRTTNQPKWASLEQKKDDADSDDSDNSDVDEPLLKTVGFIDHRAKSRQLRPKSLQIKRMRDLNRATYSEGVVRSVQFHPTSTAALVSGELPGNNLQCRWHQKREIAQHQVSKVSAHLCPHLPLRHQGLLWINGQILLRLRFARGKGDQAVNAWQN